MTPVANNPGWPLERSAGSAASLHERAIPDPPRPALWRHDVSRTALVLGSTQDDDLVDRRAAASAGVEVCRRRSGGGLVGLVPGNDLWIDVIVPARSALWSDDVGRAAHWLGATWAAALSDVLPAGHSIEVNTGPLVRRDQGRLVCFAGLGPGEVAVDGRKVVGLSQRRTRHAARFQCVMTWRWDPSWLAPLVDATALARAAVQLDGLAAGLPPELLGSDRSPSVAAVAESFLNRLPPV